MRKNSNNAKLTIYKIKKSSAKVNLKFNKNIKNEKSFKNSWKEILEKI